MQNSKLAGLKYATTELHPIGQVNHIPSCSIYLFLILSDLP